MRPETYLHWPVLLMAVIAVVLSGCASQPKQRDPNQVVLTSAANASTELAPPVAVSDQRVTNSLVSDTGSKVTLPIWSLDESDKTLKVALERWSQIAGWRLLWELGVDYRIGAAARLDGKFEVAVSAVMHNLSQAEVPPKAIFYRGNQVVRIVAKGME